MKEYGKELLIKGNEKHKNLKDITRERNEKSKELKGVTKKRNATKDLKRISNILTIYLTGIIAASMVYGGQNTKIYGLDLFINALIWTLYCLGVSKIWKCINKAKEKKVLIRNGFRMLTGDIREDEKSVVRAAGVFVVLVWLSCEGMLIFDKVLLTMGVVPVIINVKLVKRSTSHKKEFIYKREVYNRRKGLV